MGRAVTGLLVVLGGALVGCIAFGVLYGIVVSVLGVPPGKTPLMDRAVMFGLTFGLLGGAGIGAAAADKVIGERSLALVLPGVASLALAALAVVMLFSGDGWNRIFAGLGGLTGALILAWALIMTWGMNAVTKWE